jgi:hypothetical protein
MRVKRTLVISVIVLVALGAVGFIGLQVWLQVLGIDEPLADDSDLRVQREPIPADDNAYTHFVRASDILMHVLTDMQSEDVADRPLPECEEGLEPHDLPQLLYEILEARRFDTAAAENLLSRSSEVFAAFRQGMAAPYCQAPEVRWLNVDDLRLGALILLGRLVALEARCMREAKRPSDALACSLELARFGHRLQQAGGPLILCVTGMSLKSTGAYEASRRLSHGGLSPGELKEAASMLADLADSTESLRHALKVEYVFCSSAIIALCSGRLDPETFEARAAGETPPAWQFRPNETQRLLAERVRVLMANAAEPFARMSELPPLIPKGDWKHCTVLRGNALGRIQIMLVIPTLKASLVLKCQNTTRTHTAISSLAVQAFVRETQRLPRQLGELVPDYLDAVPLDDFDGKPLRYSREKKILYSVGEDLKDDGGFTEEEGKAWAKEHLYLNEGEEPDPWQLPDPSWPIEFKDEAM